MLLSLNKGMQTGRSPDKGGLTCQKAFFKIISTALRLTDVSVLRIFLWEHPIIIPIMNYTISAPDSAGCSYTTQFIMQLPAIFF